MSKGDGQPRRVLWEVQTGNTKRLVSAADEIEAVAVALTGIRPDYMHVTEVTPVMAQEWLDASEGGRSEFGRIPVVAKLRDGLAEVAARADDR